MFKTIFSCRKEIELLNEMFLVCPLWFNFNWIIFPEYKGPGLYEFGEFPRDWVIGRTTEWPLVRYEGCIFCKLDNLLYLLPFFYNQYKSEIFDDHLMQETYNPSTFRCCSTLFNYNHLMFLLLKTWILFSNINCKLFLLSIKEFKKWNYVMINFSGSV